MAALLVFLLILALFGGGFELTILWYIAVAALVIWLVGFFLAGAERRWYRW